MTALGISLAVGPVACDGCGGGNKSLVDDLDSPAAASARKMFKPRQKALPGCTKRTHLGDPTRVGVTDNV